MGPRYETEINWERAIYIDFEGRANDPASFLGVECEGVWSVDVLEPALWPAIERGHSRGEVRASYALDAYRRIQTKAETESRVVAAWSCRELDEILHTLGLDAGDATWWSKNLVNALPIAKRFARELDLDVKPRRSRYGTGKNKASLASFMDALGYEVPRIHGPGNSARRILTVRKQLEKGRSFAELTTGAKKNWTNGLSHNFHDCAGLSFVMNELSQWVALSSQYLKTEVSIEHLKELVPAREHPCVKSGAVHVVTAWNPGDKRPSPAENDSANLNLREVLELRGCQPIRAIGADPDSHHFEESWAVVGMTDAEACEIGAMFGQVAVFRISNGVQAVLDCSGRWSGSRSI